MLCGEDHAKWIVCYAKLAFGGGKLYGGIKVSKEITEIIIKDGSLIQAWDKSNLQIGHLSNTTTHNNPFGMKGY